MTHPRASWAMAQHRSIGQAQGLGLLLGQPVQEGLDTDGELRPDLGLGGLWQGLGRLLLGDPLRPGARWPALADLIVTLTGDTVHPRDLLSPSFWRGFRQARPA